MPRKTVVSKVAEIEKLIEEAMRQAKEEGITFDVNVRDGGFTYQGRWDSTHPTGDWYNSNC